MSAIAILERLHRDGLRVRTDGARVLLSPSARVTAEVLELVRANKPSLLRELAHKVGNPREQKGQPQPLFPAREPARREVIARLKAHPAVTRAFATRWEGGVLIVALAIRGIGTCELAIPADRFNRGSLADFEALLRCVEYSK